MYSREDRELAMLAVGEGMTNAEAAELVGCAGSTVGRWLSAAGRDGARKRPVYLPFERKMELVARYEAGERAADLAAEAGVSRASVTWWARRLREEGVLSIMTADEVAARAAEPAEPPSELEALRARCEELELENAILEGTIEILKKRPRRRPVRPDGGGAGGAG